MATLNPSIILAGSNPDLMASFDQGQQAGERSNQIGQQNALRSLYQTQGAGIASGNQNALNALAAIDPMASLGVQGARQDMAATSQRMRMLDDAQRQQVAAQAAQMTAQQRAEEAARIEAGLKGASFFHQSGDQAGYQRFLQQQGLDPAQYPFEQFPAIAATFGEVLDVWKGFQPGGAADLPADVASLQFRAQAAGLQPGTPEYQQFMLNAGGDPATFRALDMQAQRAGFMPGTPEYQNFMATRGAGEQAFARTTGTNTAEIATGGQAAQVVAAGAERGRAEVTSQSEVAEMQRNMPNLLALVDRLDELAGEATYGLVGRGLDAVRRGAGFEVSEGGIARAEYTALVDNQILPLLRQTFGAAFTEAEGARLRATLGNDEGTPAEKRATLEAFIQQKTRELEARGGSVPAQGAPQRGNTQDVRPSIGTVQDGFRYIGGNPANPASWEQVQ